MYTQYIEKALEMGADHAVAFTTDQIVFDPRTIIKCMFGCSDWGKGHTCPSRPGSLSMEEYEKVFRKYKGGIIIHGTNKKVTQDVSFEIERRAYFDGFYFAMSLSDCGLCRECLGHKGHGCANPKKARPAFHSIGIDVFATVRKFGLPIDTLEAENEGQNWYSAVFID